MFNGDKGRLELENVESVYRTPQKKGGHSEGMVHGENELPRDGKKKITLQKLWETPQDVPFEVAKGGHGELEPGPSCPRGSSSSLSLRRWR